MGDLKGKIEAVYFYQPESDMEVKFYNNADYEGNALEFNHPGVGKCLSEENLIFVKSIELIYKYSGVYLCEDGAGKKCQGAFSFQ